MISRSVRAPRPSSAPVQAAIERAPLRLAVTRGALGLELYEPVELGPLEVRGMTVSLPGLSFPVDLSGGVPMFRHRRGQLECAEVDLPFAALERWSRQVRSSALSGGDSDGGLAEPRFWSIPGGIGVGLSAGSAALAFDLLWAPVEADARWVVSDERGVGLGAPALGFALRVVDSCFGKLGHRAGRCYRIDQLGGQLARRILPALGARAPEARTVRLGELEYSGDRLSLRLDRRLPPIASSPRVVRALELAELACEADDQLALGDTDAARHLYLRALERAPRHPVLSRVIAEIDSWIDGRQEAALGLLVECGPVAEAGVVGVELLAHAGDVSGAVAAAEALATAEPHASLSALTWQRLAELSPSVSERFRALNQAVACAPSLAVVRWARLELHLGRGDVRAALSDVEQLEAMAQGAAARHLACVEAGRRLLRAGFLNESGQLFERAMRYCPDDPEATWGLARALGEAGRGARAAALLERAIELGERKGQVPAGALLDLARILAKLGDAPAAIARLRQVPAHAEEELDARGEEALLRGRIGDLAGASQAFARVRELIELEARIEGARAAHWLLEAASFERERQGDWLAAERHLALALRRAPRDAEVARHYREVAAEVARLERTHSAAAAAAMQALAAREVRLANAAAAERSAAPPPENDTPAELHARVERLRSRLEADPDDDSVALELAIGLERLGRDLELFALLSARIEDVGPAEAERLTPLLRGVLSRLRDEALSAGRRAEAELYALQLARWA